MKEHRPRRNEGKQTLELTWKDGKANIDLREGHNRVIKMKDQKFKDINEVLEMLNKKL